MLYCSAQIKMVVLAILATQVALYAVLVHNSAKSSVGPSSVGPTVKAGSSLLQRRIHVQSTTRSSDLEIRSQAEGSDQGPRKSDANATTRETQHAPSSWQHLIRAVELLQQPEVALSLQSCRIGLPLVPVLLWVANCQFGNARGTLACWMLISIAMNMVNKQAAMVFPSTSLLVVLQMVVTTGMVLACEHRSMKCDRWKDLAIWMIVPFLFAAILSTSIWALKRTSLATVIVFRNILPLFTFAVESLLLDVHIPSRSMTLQLVSMLIVLAGAVMYGHFDVSVNKDSAALILLNCSLVVFDRLLQSTLLKRPGFSLSMPLCVCLNNSVGIIPIVICAIATGELWEWPQAIAPINTSVWLLVVASGLCGGCLGYSSLQCQKLVSATTFLVLQNAIKILLIFLSIAAFGDSMHGVSLVGCALSMAGSILYGYMKITAETAQGK